MKTKKRQSHQPRRSEKADLPIAEFALPMSLPGATSWIRYLARLQDETFYFFHALSSRMVETTQRFAACRNFEDVVDTYATLVGDLLEDFAEEGALMATLLCEPEAEVTEAGAKTGAG